MNLYNFFILLTLTTFHTIKPSSKPPYWKNDHQIPKKLDWENLRTNTPSTKALDWNNLRQPKSLPTPKSLSVPKLPTYQEHISMHGKPTK